MVTKEHVVAESDKDRSSTAGEGASGLGIRLPVLDGALLTPVSSLKNLVVILDASLTMEAHVTNIARLVFFHLSHTRQLAPFLLCPDLATVIFVMVTFKLDYCNSLYAGLLLRLNRKIQLVRNAAV